MSEEARWTMQRSARPHWNASTLDWLRADWPGSEFLTFAGAFAASILLLVLSTDLALAQSVGGAGLEPIDNAAKQLERFLRGPFAKTVMAIAIALTGYVCATGRAPWFWFGLCIIACALIFGAPKIVEFFSQGAN